MSDMKAEWETFLSHRYIRVTGPTLRSAWSFDPDEDTPATLRDDGEAHQVAADFLERQEAIRKITEASRKQADRDAGYRHATGRDRRPDPKDANHSGHSNHAHFDYPPGWYAKGGVLDA